MIQESAQNLEKYIAKSCARFQYIPVANLQPKSKETSEKKMQRAKQNEIKLNQHEFIWVGRVCVCAHKKKVIVLNT